MAIVTRDSLKGKVKEQINSNVALPTNRYTLRIKKHSFSVSKASGNPMITLNMEIVEPKSFMLGDKEILIEGKELKPLYLTLDNVNDAAKAAKSQDAYFEFRRKLGLEEGELNTENPVLDYEKLLIDAKCGDEEVKQLQSPKPGQKPDEADPILGADGKPVPSKHYPKIMEIYGRSAIQVGQPY